MAFYLFHLRFSYFMLPWLPSYHVVAAIFLGVVFFLGIPREFLEFLALMEC